MSHPLNSTILLYHFKQYGLFSKKRCKNLLRSVLNYVFVIILTSGGASNNAFCGKFVSNPTATKTNGNVQYCTSEMSAFWIFFAALTTAYVIYYAVVISGDLIGKPKEGRTSSEETFDLGDLAPESSRKVEETDGGFRVQGDDGSVMEQELVVTRSMTDALQGGEPEEYAPKLDSTGAVITPAQKKIEAVKEDMEEIETEQNTALASNMFVSALLHGKPDVPIDKTVIPGGGTTPEDGREKEVTDDAGMHI